MSTKAIKFKWLISEYDIRSTENTRYPLMSVSQYYGVIRRSELKGDEGRAESTENYKTCKPGHIVLNRMSAASGALGLATEYGLVSPDYAVLQPSKFVDPKYVFYLMKSSWFTGQMVARLKGIGAGGESASVRTPRINIADLGDVVINIPPIEEQRRIADYLDSVCKTIDESMKIFNNLIALSEELLISKVSNLFTDEPTPDFLLGKIGNGVSLFRSGIRGRAGSTPKSSEPSFWTTSGNGVPWLSIGDLVSRNCVQYSEKDVTEIGLSEINMHPSEEEVLLFAMYASMGKVSFAPPGFVWSQAILGLSIDTINKYFLAAWFEIARPSLKALARSSTQDNLNAEQVMSLRIPFIDKVEQEEIGRKYREILEQNSNHNSLISKQTELLKELKTSLIESAITCGDTTNSITKELL